jgi:zinc D-Ala-D-Ala carboxypeptidase
VAKPGWLSQNFSENEMRCRHCSECAVDMRLINALEELRALVGPLHILSGYRCETHNAKIGGEPKSLHTMGRAADVVATKVGLKALYEAALKVKAFKESGIGVYSDEGFVHLDIGRPKQARWGRLKSKGYVAIELALKELKK